MRRRNKTGGKAAKTQRPKTLKRRDAPKVAGRREPSVDATERIALLTRERDEALHQQTATADVLKAISRSTFDLQTVLDTLVESSARLCEAYDSVIVLRQGECFRIGAHHGPILLHSAEWPIERGWVTGRAFVDRVPVHVHDLQASAHEFPDGAEFALRFGHRTILAVPLLREDEAIGALMIRRTEVKPFTEKQIELITTFAAQAVIAIENTRLLRELRESLQQQTATADVLKVISGSPGDLGPVFNTMLANAVHVCGANFGIMHRYDGGAFCHVAVHNVPPAFAEMRRSNPVIRPSPGTGLGRVERTKKVVHILDLKSEQTYRDRVPATVAMVELAGARTLLVVPMLKDDILLGTIAIYRQEVRPFTDKQIELVENFSAHAIIAIENTRLLNELQQSLQQQTATADVLKIISSSPGDLQPVFEAMLENATRICEATFGNLLLYEGDAFRLVAMHNAPPAYVELRRRNPLMHPHPRSGLARLVATRQVVHIGDIRVDPGYLEGAPSSVEIADAAGARTGLLVPMLKDNELVGTIIIYRQEVRPFTEKQIGLMQNFAAQAVIAIENTRLLNDLNKLNQQLEQRVTDQVSEIERMGRLRRFLPPQVADLIVASGMEKKLESHRREITALFCDLRGFTGFSESSDPEDVMSLLREYHAAIGEIIIKYSGTLEHYAGDGVMVFFNDPIPVPNPAMQAVQAALDMRTAIGSLTEKWRRLGHELGFGVGIAHGFATLGTIGFEGRFDYAAIGTVSNVASRLCDEAKPGQILISPRVLMAVEDAVSVEPVGEFKLKGISRPIAAYNIISAVSSKI